MAPHHHHRSGSRRKFEDFELDDVKQKSGGKTSYDIIASDCGCTAASLKKWAQILRLRAGCTVYKNIEEYVTNSGTAGMKVKQIYKVVRENEREPFDEKWRLLLWHGTQPSRIPGIIEHGFKPGSGGCFGGGIYLADRLAKSEGYAGVTSRGTKLFVLAEVAPGRVYKAHYTHSDYKSPPAGFTCVKGMGGSIPDWKKNKHYFAAILPSGPTTANTRHPSFQLSYNEYIVYDPERIIVRFVVECGV